MELNYKDCQKHLEEIQPRIGNYQWMFKLLAARTRRHGYVPSRMYRFFRRLCSQRKPYFIGTTAQGIKFVGDFHDIYSVSWILFENYDGGLVRFLEQQVTARKGAYLDVGANVGITAAVVAQILRGREEVIAFEPLPETVRRAAATFALNQLTNVRLFQMALSDQDGEITFYNAPGHSEWASAHRTDELKYKSEALLETRVQCRTLDSLMQQGVIGPVGFLKIDVEGHELSVLRGARHLLTRYRPGVLYEFNPATAMAIGWTAPESASLIQEAGGYRFQVLEENGTMAGFPPPADLDHLVNIYCDGGNFIK